MKHVYFICCFMAMGLTIASAQDFQTDDQETRKVEKWTVTGDEVEELLRELGIQNDVDTDFEDDDKVEIIRIEKNKVRPELPMLFFNGDEDFDFDFDFDDLEDTRRFKFKFDDGNEHHDFEWDGEGEMPEEMQELFEGLHNRFEWNGDGMNWNNEEFEFEEAEKRPLLGVYTDKQEDKDGVVINKVISDSGAEKVGLQEGDVLLQINGDKINSTSHLIELIQRHEVGDKIQVTYERDGKQINADATLGESNSEYRFPRMMKHHRSKGLGKSCNPHHFSKPRLGVQFQRSAEGPQTNLLIDKVIEGSTAEDAGLQAGDQILEFNGQSLSNHKSLIELLHEVEKGENVQIKVLRDGKEKTLSAEMKSEKNHIFNTKGFGHIFGKNHPFNNCEKVSDEDIIIIRKKRATDTSLGENMADEKELTLELYPNPTEGSVRLKFDGDEVPTDIRIYDAQGKEYYNATLTPAGGHIDQIIELNENPSGTLFLSLKNGDELITSKIILQK